MNFEFRLLFGFLILPVVYASGLTAIDLYAAPSLVAVPIELIQTELASNMVFVYLAAFLFAGPAATAFAVLAVRHPLAYLGTGALTGLLGFVFYAVQINLFIWDGLFWHTLAGALCGFIWWRVAHTPRPLSNTSKPTRRPQAIRLASHPQRRETRFKREPRIGHVPSVHNL